MTFWGVEVKPGKPYILICEDLGGKLILTQATLGTVSSPKKSTLQCIIGDKSPVFLCTLVPDKSECCSLNLEFEEECDVKFSIIGPASIHLSGFLQADHPDMDGGDFDSDSFGEDIAETESEDSDYDSEGGDYDFIDDDGDPSAYQTSRLPNRGVVIEEIVDDEKAGNENNGTKQPKRRNQLTDSESNKTSQQQIVLKDNTSATVLESEDEDGFPVSSSRKSEPDSESPEAGAERQIVEEGKKKNKKKNATKDDNDGAKNLKRKADAHVEDSERIAGQETAVTGASEAVLDGSLSQKKKKKKGKAHESGVAPNEPAAMDKNANPIAASERDKVQKLNADGDANGDLSEGKKKKKNKKGKKETCDAMITEDKNTPEKGAKESKAKPSKVRTFPNGLVIEELEMGRPDGKRASRGSKVSVRYIGKLQKNGKHFDSNIGGPPFKFRLGVGQVIKGWDVGVEGMRVGDKRRLTIPPSMGYGSSGAPPQIPPNAWLVFDVELVNVA